MPVRPAAPLVTRQPAQCGWLSGLLLLGLVVLQACGGGSESALIASAEQRLARDDVAGAVIDARNALKNNERSAAARLTLGRALTASGDFATAENELRRAREFGADESRWAVADAALLEARRDLSALLARYKDTRLPDPDAHAALRLAVARAYRDQRQVEAAASVLDELQATKPDLVEVRVLRVRLAAAKGDVDAARRASIELVQRAPNDAQAWLLRADTLAQDTANRAEAVAAYRRALELRPRLLEAHANLISLLLDLNDHPAATAQAAAMRKALPDVALADFYAALVAYAGGEHLRVRELTQRMLRNPTSSPQVLYLAGMAELRLGSLAQAETLLARAVLLAPTAIESRRELAGILVRRARPEAALATLDPLLKLGVDDAGVWRYAGQAHSLAGNFRLADQAFARSVKLRPDDARNRVAVGQALIARGQVDPGLRELRSAAAADQASIDADLELVNTLALRERHDDALKALDALARKRPELAVVDQLRGRVLQARGDRAGARRAYEAALARDATMVMAADSLARLDATEGRIGDARKRYESLLKRDPRAPAVMLALAELSLREGAGYQQAGEWISKAVQANPLDVSVWRTAIALHRDTGDQPGALARARAALAAVPDDPTLLAQASSVQLEAGDHQQALATAQRLVQLLPRSVDAAVQLARAHAAAGNASQAQQQVARALEIEPDSASVLRGAIEVAVRIGQHDRAVALARQVQQRRPGEALGWQLESEAEASRGQWAAAAVALKQAMAKQPSTAVAIQAHRAFSRAGQRAEAELLEKRWLAMRPRDQGFRIHLGEEAIAAGDWALAEARFRRALEADPDNPALLNNLAYALVRRGDASALEPALKAARAAPYIAEIIDTLSLAYELAGNLPKAVEAQALVVTLAPRNADYRIRLGGLHLKAGDRGKAREALAPLRAEDLSVPQAETLQKLRQQAQA